MMIDPKLLTLIQVVIDSITPDGDVDKVAVEVLSDYVTSTDLHKRLMIGGGEPHYIDCCEYSDALVDPWGNPRFGDLSRLEWMLREVVGRCRRQDVYVEKLEAQHARKQAIRE